MAEVTKFQDTKTGAIVVIIELIYGNKLMARVRRLKDNKCYILPYDELKLVD